jgi:biotin--protein ligase
MNVLVYSSSQVSQTSLSHTLITLRSVLFPHYSIQTISAKSLSTEPWSSTCALLVFPYYLDFSMVASAISALRGFVENGRRVLAFGASASSAPALGSYNGNQVLSFCDKTTGNTLYPTFNVSAGVGDGPSRFAGQEKLEHVHDSFAPVFAGLEGAANVVTLAKYTENAEGEKIAAVQCHFGDGEVILWRPNTEHPISDAFAEDIRRDWIRRCLQALGLHPPSAEQTRLN